MDKQPEALRLAAWIEHRVNLMVQDKQAADELRRLHEVNQELVKALEGVLRVADRKTDEFDVARAALTKARGEE